MAAALQVRRAQLEIIGGAPSFSVFWKRVGTKDSHPFHSRIPPCLRGESNLSQIGKPHSYSANNSCIPSPKFVTLTPWGRESPAGILYDLAAKTTAACINCRLAFWRRAKSELRKATRSARFLEALWNSVPPTISRKMVSIAIQSAPEGPRPQLLSSQTPRTPPQSVRNWPCNLLRLRTLRITSLLPRICAGIRLSH
jgi:hypothetical protein